MTIPKRTTTRSHTRAPQTSAGGAGGDDVDYVEIEVKARTVDLAVEAAMQELGVTDREDVEVSVITEPVKGFLGMGGQDAVVRVKKRPARRRRNRKRREPVSSGNTDNNPKNRQQDRPNTAKNGGGRTERRGSSTTSGGK